MEERILTTRKNGMIVLLAVIALYVIAVAGVILLAGFEDLIPTVVFVLGMVVCIGVLALALADWAVNFSRQQVALPGLV